jgi:outer membrane receptor for ferrienterochelin and colicin
MIHGRKWVVLTVLLLGWAGSALAQTTGSISGHVTDETNSPLAGVVIEAKGPSLQGSRAVASDASGNYRLNLLPPGVFTVSFTLPGSKARTREGIVVGLGKDTALDQTLRSTLTEEVTVIAEAPTIDTGAAELGLNLSQRSVQTLPTDRNYASIVQVVPGVSSDASNNNLQQSSITVYGSSGAENTYLIDGINTTGVEYGFQGKEMNFEFVEEVEVKTGGYEAEYGRSTGGIVNVITKSGGNEFHGDVFAYYDNDSLQSTGKSVAAPTPVGVTKKDFGVGFGGFMVKDKLWFFLAYDRVDNTLTNRLQEGPQAGQDVDTGTTRDLASAKLTWRISDEHSLIATYLQDPTEQTGAINDASHTLIGDPLTYLGKQEFGGRDFALRYQGILAPNWTLVGQIARHQEKNNVGPATAAGDIVQLRDADNNFFQTGGFGLIQKKEFQRDVASLAATWVIGEHEVKGGVELEKQQAEVVKRMSGGQQVDRIANPNTSSPEPFVYRHSYWTTPDATVNNAPLSALNASPEHENTTLFLQDRWSVAPAVTISFGLRWDRQQIIDASGTKQIDLKKDWAPRLGVIWDPTGDHKSKVFGNYGRFYEQLPMDLVIRSFSYERQPRIINYSPTDISPNASAESDLATPSAILGGFTEPSDPNIKGQYVSEFLLGGEREVAANWAIGAKLIYRKYDRVIEDFLCRDDGTYCIGNPGSGIMREIFTLDYSQTLPAPKPKRVFKGIQLDASKRFSDNWQGIASYLYSKLDGNYDGTFAPYTNVGADPNISAAYDYYDFFTNGSDLSTITNTGPLSNDRRHQIKASGVYITPIDLELGISAYLRSGTPVTRYGYSDAYGRYEFFLTPRGAEGRTPWTYEADVHLGYPIAIKKTSLKLILDVFNLLNAQRAVLLDQRWGFQEADNASPTPVNPSYKQPLLRTPPRAFRVGMRLSF